MSFSGVKGISKVVKKRGFRGFKGFKGILAFGDFRGLSDLGGF